jgi:hypothetical protein
MLYLCSPSGISWPVLGCTVPLPVLLHKLNSVRTCPISLACEQFICQISWNFDERLSLRCWFTDSLEGQMCSVTKALHYWVENTKWLDLIACIFVLIELWIGYPVFSYCGMKFMPLEVLPSCFPIPQHYYWYSRCANIWVGSDISVSLRRCRKRIWYGLVWDVWHDLEWHYRGEFFQLPT